MSLHYTILHYSTLSLYTLTLYYLFLHLFSYIYFLPYIFNHINSYTFLTKLYKIKSLPLPLSWNHAGHSSLSH